MVKGKAYRPFLDTQPGDGAVVQLAIDGPQDGLGAGFGLVDDGRADHRLAVLDITWTVEPHHVGSGFLGGSDHALIAAASDGQDDICPAFDHALGQTGGLGRGDEGDLGARVRLP